jgi:hypothetical protein
VREGSGGAGEGEGRGDEAAVGHKEAGVTVYVTDTGKLSK